MADDILVHYGILRRSGRYPWGSGGELLNAIDKLSSEGLSETEIAAALNISTYELRNQKTLAKNELKEAQRLGVISRRESGMSLGAIAEEMGLPKSTVAGLLKPEANRKHRAIEDLASVLADSIEKFNYIDVGEGVERFLGVTDTKLKNAIQLLVNRGYKVHFLHQMQMGTGKNTSIKVLTKGDVDYNEVSENRVNLAIPNFTSKDNGRTFEESAPINNISSKRLTVVYGKDGSDRDGLIEVREGVPELSLAGKRYAQVRIGIDGTHYIKGMAVYGRNMPEGTDIVFYTSKNPSSDKLAALKPQKVGDINPFGSAIQPQRRYLDSDGKEQISAMNVVYEEGDWYNWTKSLSSQFLSKQSPRLAARQLDIAFQRQKLEYDEIMALENETVKAHLLYEFANKMDSAAVHLKAASMPRQSTAVLIPEPTLKPNEVYAPNYRDGDIVKLIRHPHGSISEIPTLTVNNKSRNARGLIGTATDAIAIHPKVAERLSGADFDGDTVIVIPDKKHIATSPALEGLKGFDPIKAYPKYPGMKVLKPETKQRLMGDVSNLITDMTIKGANQSEIARAVRHSMVIIDAEKHELNYRQSHIDNGISALKAKYQGGPTSGAATLISRASSMEMVDHRKDNYNIDPSTGKKVWTYTNETYVKDTKSGPVTLKRQTKSTKMYETDDALKLSSGTIIESVYGEHANRLKRLGDLARKSYLTTKPTKYSPSARKTYAKEVASLEAKYNLALRNQPLERKAQLVAGQLYKAKVAANPDMSRADKKKARGRSIVVARLRVNANKPTIEITPREWEAIQMGAISPTRLKRILRNADADQVRALATPRSTSGLSPGKRNRALALLSAGYTTAEVASSLGVSVNQVIEIKD